MARPLSKWSWLALVQKQPHSVLDHKARAVAAALVMHADRDAVVVSAAVDVLVQRTALSRSSVIRGLQQLERDCWITARRGGGGRPSQSRRVTNTYRMGVPAWGKSGCHTDTQTGQSGCHTDTQTEPPERQSGCHTDTLLRGKELVAEVRANTTAPDPPIRGQQIRDILTHRNTHAQSSGAGP
jgi:hypothetical protein